MGSPVIDKEITIEEYLRYILDRWRMLVTVVVVGAAVAGLYSLLVMGQVYTAQGSIIATGQLATPPTALEGLVRGLRLEVIGAAVNPEVEVCKGILQSRTIGEKLVRDYDLGPIFGTSSEETAIAALKQHTKIKTQEPNIVHIEVRLSGVPWAFAGGESNGRIRRLTAGLVNGYIEALQEKIASFHLSAAKRKRVFLAQKKRACFAQLKRDEQALQQWESKNRLINTQEASKLATEGLVELQQNEMQAELELAALSEGIAKAKQLLCQQPQLRIASLEQEANPLIMQLRERLIKLEADIATAVEIKGETEFHPEVEELQQQIGATKQALAEQQQQQMYTARRVQIHNPAIEKLLGQLLPLQIKKEAVTARSEGLRRAIAEAERGIVGLSAQVMEYGRLVREVRVRETVYQAVVNEYEQALIAEQGDEPQVYVLDQAVVPERASAPRVGVNMGLAALAGMIIAILWALAQGESQAARLASRGLGKTEEG